MWQGEHSGSMYWLVRCRSISLQSCAQDMPIIMLLCRIVYYYKRIKRNLIFRCLITKHAWNCKKKSRQKDKIYGPCVFCDVARSDISRHMLSTHKHEQKIIDPAPVNKNECARCSGPNCWKRWPGTPSWRSWRRPNDSPSGEKHIRRAKGERLHDTSDSAIAAAGERSVDGRDHVGGLQFIHPSRGDHQDVYRGREIKTGTQDRSDEPI